VLVARERLSKWHLRLLLRVRASGAHPVLVLDEGGAPLPRGLSLLRTLEGLLYGLRSDGPSAPASVAGLDVRAAIPADTDVVLDLVGRDGPAALDEAKVLALLFDGTSDEMGALSAILDGRAPDLLVVDSATGACVAAGLPTIERRDVVTASLDGVLARAADLCATAIEQVTRGYANETARVAGVPTSPPRTGSLARFATAALSRKLIERIVRLSRDPQHWRVGWRRTGAMDEVAATGRWPAAGYAWLPDDGQRFYADPFVMHDGGRAYVLCEEYPYATGKGLISAFEIGPDGRASAPRPVLETGSHLSYPHIFRRDGAVWMIPESSAAGTVELYRADPFPHRWVKESVLIEGRSLADATMVEWAGRLWLFAASNDAETSSWDALTIHSATSLLGPWRQHGPDPALIDAGAARPAGAMTLREGRLWRAAQDCTGGYGSGLALCVVERLDEGGFAQRVMHRLPPDPAWGAAGSHTINAADGFEVVDAAGPRRAGTSAGTATVPFR